MTSRSSTPSNVSAEQTSGDCFSVFAKSFITSGSKLYIYRGDFEDLAAASGQCMAECTLGGVIEILDAHFGLTVAHPLFYGSSHACSVEEDVHAGKFHKVGQIEAYSFGDKPKLPSVNQASPLSSDWALISLNPNWATPEATKLVPRGVISSGKLELTDVSSLIPQNVVISTGFSGNVAGELNLVPTSLIVGNVLFDTLRIDTKQALGMLFLHQSCHVFLLTLHT